MLGFFGFLTVGIIVFLLLKKVTVPALAFVVVPTVMCIIAGYGGFMPEKALTVGQTLETFSFLSVGRFMRAGVRSTYETAALFIFSITFFCVISDTGMFDRIINGLAKKAGNNVTMVCLLTCFIAMIAHLDGSGASTFLITIPAMYPVFKKLKMRNTSLMLIMVAAMGVMNLTPWGGPTLRAATVIKMDANELWKSLLPIQGLGIVLAVTVAVLVAREEKKLGAGFDPQYAPEGPSGRSGETQEDKAKTLARPALFWFNIILTIGTIAALTVVKVPSFYIFMISTAIVLFVNYPGEKAQSSRIGAHAKGAMMMASTLLAAGVFLGILEGSGMMDAMGQVLVGIIPKALGPYVALVIGFFSVPLALCFATDEYFYGVMPIVVRVAESYSVPSVSVAVTMVACRNMATFISPMVPAALLGCGLAEVDITDHIKRSFLWVWGMSVIMMIFGLIVGVIPLGR
jgi:CitMHS family citrate-Mg2+:H+ or citrate-Ca2+:H+ symporter